MTGTVLIVVLVSKFLTGAWITSRDGGHLRDDAGHPQALRPGRRRDRRRRGGHAAAQPGARRGAGVPDAPADHARAGIRPGDPAGHPRGGHRQRRPARDGQSGPGMGGPGDPGDAEGHRLPVPGDHQADPGLRQTHPEGLAPRRRLRLPAGVRGRTLVGTGAAQPVGAAAEGTAAVHPRRHGHLGALAAVQLRAGLAPHPGTGRPGDLHARSSLGGQPAGAPRPFPVVPPVSTNGERGPGAAPADPDPQS